MISFQYDPEADALYVPFIFWNGQKLRTKQLDDRRNVDYDEDGNVVGLEFLFVSEGIDLTGVPEAERVRELLSAVRNLPFIRERSTASSG